MNGNHTTPWMKRAASLLLAGALIAAGLIAARQNSPAQAANLSAPPAVLSPTLSYYFISGNTFTPSGGVSYSRQVTGCVNQMPLNTGFSAPVHLPQGSQVVSIRVYTWNDEASQSTNSAAQFISGDGMGGGGAWYSASSLTITAGYQQNDSLTGAVVIDNQNNNYVVEWRKLGVSDSTLLSLCGVRVAYYAPGNGVFAPLIRK